MSVLTINKLTASVGAEVAGVDPERLANDDASARPCSRRWRTTACWCSAACTWNPQAQVAFCRAARRDRPVGRRPPSGVGHLPDHAGQDEEQLGRAYLKATFDWHIDGCTPTGDECPQKATVLSAMQVAEPWR